MHFGARYAAYWRGFACGGEEFLRLLYRSAWRGTRDAVCNRPTDTLGGMGFLIHGGTEYEFEDRLLAHLKMVIGQKLKKQECFFVSWTKSAEEGSGRVSVWLSPYTTVAFRFAGSRPPELNPAWVKVLIALSHSNRGLVVISEDDAVRYAQKNPDLI